MQQNLLPLIEIYQILKITQQIFALVHNRTHLQTIHKLEAIKTSIPQYLNQLSLFKHNMKDSFTMPILNALFVLQEAQNYKNRYFLLT